MFQKSRVKLSEKEKLANTTLVVHTNDYDY